MSAIPAFQLKQEDYYEFQDNLGYRMRFCLKISVYTHVHAYTQAHVICLHISIIVHISIILTFKEQAKDLDTEVFPSPKADARQL